ncbi:hypothetical protein [Nocardioides taihuensis]|uniref:Uncharacterized protein n=1 Tax=Nocardioides taihuensis TaxID=1835606 RepID=A0ABW0BQN8_9ACTN
MWLAEAADRAAFDTFAAKVSFKGKNALDLFISVNGFTKPALDRYSEKARPLQWTVATCLRSLTAACDWTIS